MNVLASHGITSTNVLEQLRKGTVPPALLGTVKLVHGKNASVKKALAQAKTQS